LAGLAQHTRSITLGPLVSNIVLRHPALLTRQALTVAELSGGRLDLGIGSGYDAGDHAAVGEPVWSGPERSGRFADALAIVAAGVGDAVRLTVAGHGRRAIRLAATYGDTWVSYGGFRLPSDRALELTRRRVAMLEDAGGAGLGRRLLCGSAALTSEPIWRSVDAFEDFVGRYHAVGITEFAFHWPPANTNPEVDPAVVAEVTRRIASRPGRPGQDVRAVTSDANSAS
jgi:alkanesulfonate monooxygenase SsuD/methylene tetrahydromethanopterin reductase-like flavin-dependent oxidoreductase (luciferase family)